MRLWHKSGLTPALVGHRHFSSLFLKLLIREQVNVEQLEASKFILQQLLAQKTSSLFPTPELDNRLSKLLTDVINGILGRSTSHNMAREELQESVKTAKDSWEAVYGSLDSPEVQLNIDRVVAALEARRKRNNV